MFDFLKRNGNSSYPSQTLNVQNPLNASSSPEVEERVFIEPASNTAATTGHFTEKVPDAIPTDHNIGLLYLFLDRNHETKGYDDALMNPDVSHLNQNLLALKSELVRTVNKVLTFYEDFIQETEYHILTRAKSGMVDMVEELEMKKKIALGHVTKVREIEENLDQENGDCAGILISYTRGFKNGLAAISHHHILTRRF